MKPRFPHVGINSNGDEYETESVAFTDASSSHKEFIIRPSVLISNFRQNSDEDDQSIKPQRSYSQEVLIRPCGDLEFDTIQLPDDGPSADIELRNRMKNRVLVYNLCCVASAGILALICRWFPKFKARVISERAVNPAFANMLLIKSAWGDSEIVELIQSDPDSKKENIPFFVYKSARFAYDRQENRFVYFSDKEIFKPNFLRCEGGLSDAQVEHRSAMFGENLIDIFEPSWFALLIQEILHPFFVFQIFSIIIWGIELYFNYAIAVLIISIITVATSLYQTKRNIRRLRELSHLDIQVQVIRNKEWTRISSVNLVPGDVISLNGLNVIPCDAYLLRGECLVDESSLTGESIPISKWPIMSNPETSRKISEGGDADEEVLEIKKASLLLLGSKMLKSPFDEKCEYTALVKATGFSSVKGRLYRSMLHPPPSNSKMYNDSFKFIAVLFAASLLGVVYSVYVFISYGYEFWDIVIRAFDLIAAVVPQTLPATISIGIEFSLKRLKKRRIYCISPQKINLAGKVDLICFDKTGTLTEDTLTFYSVGLKQNDYSVALCNDRFSIYKKSEGSLVSQIMASCHSIREIDGKLIGDPLDLEMLDACGWTYEENSTILAENEIKNYLIGTCYPAGDSPSFFKKIDIIKRFDFTPEKKFMSVVAKMNKELYIFAKGAPEMILKMCTPHSFSKPIIHEIDAFAKKGFRVLCFAWKKIQSRVNPKKMNREKLESDLDFSGFILFENRLKAESESVVADLNECGIKSIISTGDNVYTAVYVSRECGMIDESDTILISSSSKSDGIMNQEFEFSSCTKKSNYEGSVSLNDALNNADLITAEFAMDGNLFERCKSELPLEVYKKIFLRTRVFARMSPVLKRQLIDNMKDFGNTVLMCGDGANDCGALKAADVGISLSEAEASAAAPFTSHDKNVSCVLSLVSEGRASLTTSLSCFKYMALYSVTEFTTTILLYSFTNNIGDLQYLYIDLILIPPLSILTGYTTSLESLSKDKPVTALFSFPVLLSFIGHSLIQMGFQMFLFFNLRIQEWYSRIPETETDEYVYSYENTVFFLFCNFIYISLSWILSAGPPYKKRAYTNPYYLVSFAILFSFSLFLLFAGLDIEWIAQKLQLESIDLSYRVLIFISVILYIILSALFEYLVTKVLK